MKRTVFLRGDEDISPNASPLKFRLRVSDKTDKKTVEFVKRKWRVKPQLIAPFSIQTLDDLINLAWNYEGDAFQWFNLWKLIPALTELNNMIGMASLKRSIIDLILYYIQGLNIPPPGIKVSEDGGDMLHTVLYGGPGTGKTTVAKILAKIYCGLGFLSRDEVTIAKREDFIGKYVGHSEDKTKELLEKAVGGVLFIDEAYSMGQSERVDSFSKAILDQLNQFLTENKKNFICIIAGYEKELEECFFSVNPGLKRRFPWSFKIENYSYTDLDKMFRAKVKKEGWLIEDDLMTSAIFQKNIASFPYFGGDIDNFFSQCKITHTRRIFGLGRGKRVLNKTDIDLALEEYIKYRTKPKEILSYYL